MLEAHGNCGANVGTDCGMGHLCENKLYAGDSSYQLEIIEILSELIIISSDCNKAEICSTCLLYLHRIFGWSSAC